MKNGEWTILQMVILLAFLWLALVMGSAMMKSVRAAQNAADEAAGWAEAAKNLVKIMDEMIRICDETTRVCEDWKKVNSNSKR